MALTDSLISYWKCDEASGSILDSHGTNHLTLTTAGTPGSVAGKINTARHFTLSNQEYLTRSDNADLSTGDIDFTFAAWVMMDSKPAGTNAYIAAKGTNGSGSDHEWSLDYQNFSGQDEIRFWIGTSFALSVTAAIGSPTVGVWYYIVCWHDSVGNTINIQVNNGTVASQATGGTAPVDGAGRFTLGNFGILALSWDGSIDEAAFWKRTLTTQERTDLYNAGNGFAYPFVANPAVAGPYVCRYGRVTSGRAVAGRITSGRGVGRVTSGRAVAGRIAGQS